MTGPKRWLYRVLGWLLGSLLCLGALNVPRAWWLSVILPLLAAYIAAMLVLVPGLMASLLHSLRQRTLAARYSGWAARHWPFAAHRRFCAMQAATIYSQLDDPVYAAEFADLGIALNEPLLHLPRVRVAYAVCINVKGKLALDAGRYTEAFEAFYRPLRMSLEHRLYIPMFLSNCAAAMYCLGKFEEGLEYTQRALALNPPQQTTLVILAHHNAAISLIETGKPTEALAESEKAVAVKVPRTLPFHQLAMIAHAYTLALNYDQAASEDLFAEAAALIAPQERALRQRLHGMRGLVRWEQGRLDEAEADLRLGLDGPSVAPQCLYHLALIADRRGDKAQVQNWRERLLREVPESFYAERVRQARGTGVV